MIKNGAGIGEIASFFQTKRYAPFEPRAQHRQFARIRIEHALFVPTFDFGVAPCLLESLRQNFPFDDQSAFALARAMD